MSRCRYCLPERWAGKYSAGVNGLKIYHVGDNNRWHTLCDCGRQYTLMQKLNIRWGYRTCSHTTVRQTSRANLSEGRRNSW